MSDIIIQNIYSKIFPLYITRTNIYDTESNRLEREAEILWTRYNDVTQQQSIIGNTEFPIRRLSYQDNNINNIYSQFNSLNTTIDGYPNSFISFSSSGITTNIYGSFGRNQNTNPLINEFSTNPLAAGESSNFVKCGKVRFVNP